MTTRTVRSASHVVWPTAAAAAAPMLLPTDVRVGIVGTGYTARGLAHYMEIYNGGGGQAAELGDMGGCGAGAYWACFLHEFGRWWNDSMAKFGDNMKDAGKKLDDFNKGQRDAAKEAMKNASMAMA